ncbi:hypothetical protein BU26DRAFT_350414 [Trematosphaeria pertusa]|uniref:Uncharacterized protein n=1 Tax=Trematosphaeria pertusa TaxID=390896 RepID=A0A6A6ICH4_9PLEO|nr:uncharacterized protein BU26DRAFT_350414 [Trematosphaeria pertusa]KAF2247602.1 hypothetical protein BU26DRAFT_350414 [Trematosphaeria pertusa]
MRARHSRACSEKRGSLREEGRCRCGRGRTGAGKASKMARHRDWLRRRRIMTKLAANLIPAPARPPASPHIRSITVQTTPDRARYSSIYGPASAELLSRRHQRRIGRPAARQPIPSIAQATCSTLESGAPNHLQLRERYRPVTRLRGATINHTERLHPQRDDDHLFFRSLSIATSTVKPASAR